MTFRINLSVLLDCLTIFGTSSLPGVVHIYLDSVMCITCNHIVKPVHSYRKISSLGKKLITSSPEVLSMAAIAGKQDPPCLLKLIQVCAVITVDGEKKGADVSLASVSGTAAAGEAKRG